jgi:hypothetical protein
LSGGLRKQVVGVNRNTQSGQAMANLAHPFDTPRPLPFQEPGEAAMPRVDKIPEHVNVPSFMDGCDLNAVNEPDTSRDC